MQLNKISSIEIKDPSSIRWLLIMIMAFLFLEACSNSANENVQEFVQRTKEKKTRNIETLPEFKQYKAFTFTATNIRSPFDPATPSLAQKPSATLTIGPGPDLSRPREALESFPLESLRMVGTLEKGGQFFALLKDSHGNIHRVTIGNHVGQNFGRIEKIKESEIEVQEWVADQKGGWQTRMVPIHLSK